MPRRRFITYNGETRTLSQWAASAGLPPKTLSNRLDREGLPMDRALATGVKTRAQAGRRGASAGSWFNR